MKKFLSAFMAVAMLATSAVAFSACGSNSGSSTTESSSASTAAITSADDLVGKSIGVQLGTTGDIYVSDEYESQGSTVQRYNKGADAIVALLSDKIDAVIIDKEPANAFLAANSGLKILDDPFVEEEYAIAIAKDNTDLLEKFNTALSELKADGTLQSIFDNYIGDDTKGKSPYTTPDGTEYPNGELHMATNAFFEPYEFYDGDTVVGIDAMAAQAICDKLGYQLVIDDMDFDAVVTAVQTGKADFGMAGMTVTDERKEAISFTDSYATSTQVIIVKE